MKKLPWHVLFTFFAAFGIIVGGYLFAELYSAYSLGNIQYAGNLDTQYTELSETVNISVQYPWEFEEFPDLYSDGQREYIVDELSERGILPILDEILPVFGVYRIMPTEENIQYGSAAMNQYIRNDEYSFHLDLFAGSIALRFHQTPEYDSKMLAEALEDLEKLYIDESESGVFALIMAVADASAHANMVPYLFPEDFPKVNEVNEVNTYTMGFQWENSQMLLFDLYECEIFLYENKPYILLYRENHYMLLEYNPVQKNFCGLQFMNNPLVFNEYYEK